MALELAGACEEVVSVEVVVALGGEGTDDDGFGGRMGGGLTKSAGVKLTPGGSPVEALLKESGKLN